MNKILFTIFMMQFVCGNLLAQQFGEKVDRTLVQPISKILENPDQFFEQKLTIEGQIVAVCTKRGCWMDFASDKKFQTFRVKVHDGTMVFPLSAMGKKAYATGELQKIYLPQKLAINYLKHLAEERGEKFDPATVKGAISIYQLAPTGVLIE